MRILVSSEILANELEKFLFNTEKIKTAVVAFDSITLNSGSQSVEIYCEVIEGGGEVNQSGRRWDKLKELVDLIDDQPVTLVIKENSLEAIFTY